MSIRPARSSRTNASTTTGSNWEPAARWSLAIVSELASRFGAGREGDLNVSWFEIDLPD